MRRVGVIVTRRVLVIVVVMTGAGFAGSMVGVNVVGSRVGMGACVGVAWSVPRGKSINVGSAWVGGAARTVRGTIVGVAGRSSRLGRTMKLILPTQ